MYFDDISGGKNKKTSIRIVYTGTVSHQCEFSYDLSDEKHEQTLHHIVYTGTVSRQWEIFDDVSGWEVA